MELLVRIIDKAEGDPDHSPALTRRGDVIAWRPVGAGWGREELLNPAWRILLVPGLTEVEAESLTQHELPSSLDADPAALRKRHMAVDLDALPELPRHRHGGTARVTHDLEVPLEVFRSAYGLKPPAAGPAADFDLIG